MTPDAVQREYDLPSLPPEQMLIAAKPIKRESGQLGETQEDVADARIGFGSS